MKFLLVIVWSLLSSLAVAKLEDGDCEGTRTAFYFSLRLYVCRLPSVYQISQQVLSASR